MHNKQIVLSIAISFAIVIGAVFYFTQIQQKPQIRTTLSARSKEFIKKQRQTESSLQFVDLTGPVGDDTRNKRVGRAGCYSFVIPYRVSVTKYEDTSGNMCSTRFSFDSPKGSIIAYMYKKPVLSWDDVSGVSLRRREATEYSEEEQVINGKTFLLFRKAGDIYEKNVFYYTPNYFFVFNLLTATNENLDGDVEKMLGSLIFE